MDLSHEFHSHPVFYEEGGYSHLGGFIDFHSRKGTSIFVLADTNTLEHCLPLLEKKWGTRQELQIIEMPAGEEHKNIDTCNDIWQMLTQAFADRNSIIINLGGGVVCDIGGFAASVYKRGIRFIHFPTSLLAMTDAAIGGKTAIDLGSLKNIIGSFSQPMAVFIDTDFLETLPERELKNGFAEMLKHGLIAEESYFDELVKCGPGALTPEHIRLSVEIKSAIVIRDPFEKNYRKALNFGHTIGHALESFSLQNDNYTLLHGEAVILGMLAETFISLNMQLLPEHHANRIIEGLQKYMPAYQFTERAIEEVISLINHDKKNVGVQPCFTLLRQVGMPVIDQHCNPEVIREALVWLMDRYD